MSSALAPGDVPPSRAWSCGAQDHPHEAGLWGNSRTCITFYQNKSRTPQPCHFATEMMTHSAVWFHVRSFVVSQAQSSRRVCMGGVQPVPGRRHLLSALAVAASGRRGPPGTQRAPLGCWGGRSLPQRRCRQGRGCLGSQQPVEPHDCPQENDFH